MNASRRLVLALALAAAFAPSAFAGSPQPFDASAFAAAQAAGRPILVEITAPWCPICRVQKPILEKLASEPRFSDMAVFAIDFDSQKDLMARFGVSLQSTLVMFRGEKEVGRSTGETQPEWIEALLEKGL
ncbi:thioredoxin family protein [Methylocella sp.]|uniref:thioredoxin family protein n=1 Tax=Methylocella sp. TaxID=1978226 RepID=UPI0035B16342